MWGALGGSSDPPEAQKSISYHRNPFLGRFGKIDFSTIVDPLWSPIPPGLPCVRPGLPKKLEYWGKMAIFEVPEAGKPVLLPPRAQTPEVVASNRRIDVWRAFLVHFGQILGDLGVDFGKIQDLRRGHGGSLGLF